jgi:hypothetical protein
MTLAWGDLASLAPDDAAPAAVDATAPQERLAAFALAIARRPDLWRPLIRHDADLRWHCRLADLGDSEVWLLGWTSDQEVEWHDHGGSAGAFAVAEGELHETYTERGDPAPLRTARCPVGSTRAFGASRIHHVTNRAGAPATSIHVYAPRLTAMRFYDLTPGQPPGQIRTERILSGDAIGAVLSREENLS